MRQGQGSGLFPGGLQIRRPRPPSLWVNLCGAPLPPSLPIPAGTSPGNPSLLLLSSPILFVPAAPSEGPGRLGIFASKYKMCVKHSAGSFFPLGDVCSANITNFPFSGWAAGPWNKVCSSPAPLTAPHPPPYPHPCWPSARSGGRAGPSSQPQVPRSVGRQNASLVCWGVQALGKISNQNSWDVGVGWRNLVSSPFFWSLFHLSSKIQEASLFQLLFIHPFIHSFSKYYLNAHCVPGRAGCWGHSGAYS